MICMLPIGKSGSLPVSATVTATTATRHPQSSYQTHTQLPPHSFLDGVAQYDYSSVTVSGVGNICGDSIADVVIDAYGADLNGVYSGSSYVVFGRDSDSLFADDFEGS